MQKSSRRVLLDVGDRRVDLERLSDRNATLRAEKVPPQTAKVSVE